jgi:predicted  nucleic acid-binding Zn-ribbon protein
MNSEDISKLIVAMKEVFPTADMIQRGFSHVDERFEQISDRFEQIDQRFEQMDQRFDQIDGRLAHIDARLNTIERDIRDLVSREEFTDLTARVKYLEMKLGVESGK